MRVVTALMKHEANTFSPVPTPLERFAQAVIDCAGVGVRTSDYG